MVGTGDKPRVDIELRRRHVIKYTDLVERRRIRTVIMLAEFVI